MDLDPGAQTIFKAECMMPNHQDRRKRQVKEEQMEKRRNRHATEGRRGNDGMRSYEKALRRKRQPRKEWIGADRPRKQR